MNAKEAAEKYAHQYCISFSVDAYDLELNAEITDTISKHFISGAAWAREQILELLRSGSAGVFTNMGREATADFIEKTLKEGEMRSDE